MTTLEQVKAEGVPGKCLGCIRPLPKDSRPGQEWCRRQACLRKRARIYAKDIRRRSTLVAVKWCQYTEDRRVEMHLACSCVLNVSLSRIRKAVHCKKHPEGLAQ